MACVITSWKNKKLNCQFQKRKSSCKWVKRGHGIHEKAGSYRECAERSEKRKNEQDVVGFASEGQIRYAADGGEKAKDAGSRAETVRCTRTDWSTDSRGWARGSARSVANSRPDYHAAFDKCFRATSSRQGLSARTNTHPMWRVRENSREERLRGFHLQIQNFSKLNSFKKVRHIRLLVVWTWVCAWYSNVPLFGKAGSRSDVSGASLYH